jgi:hypothetical protein
VQIEWPSGKIEQVSGIAADETITIQEGKGIIAATKFAPGVKAPPAGSKQALRAIQ